MSISTTASDIDPRTALTALGFVIGTNLVGASPVLVAGSDTSWIEKPAFYPPELAFPVVWTLLFTLLGLGTFLVWQHGTHRRAVRIALAAFAGQFVLNLAWTPVFFRLQRPGLALAVIVALFGAICGTIYAFDQVDRRAALLLVPYLVWVGFATVLNYAIWAA